MRLPILIIHIRFCDKDKFMKKLNWHQKGGESC
jgi:hypothetical protein